MGKEHELEVSGALEQVGREAAPDDEEVPQHGERYSCPICLDEFKDRFYVLDQCGHRFHACCLKEYWEKTWPEMRCPYCRGTPKL